MKRRYLIFMAVLCLAVLPSVTFAMNVPSDSDNDGIADSVDNCVEVANQSQADFDRSARYRMLAIKS